MILHCMAREGWEAVKRAGSYVLPEGEPFFGWIIRKHFRNSPSERCYFRRTHIPCKVYKCALLLSASELFLLKRKFFSVWKMHKSIWIGIFFLFCSCQFLPFCEIMFFYDHVSSINFIPLLIHIASCLDPSAY